MSKHELWTQRIADWQSSGLSQRAFCQQHDLAISTFNTWLRKIRQAPSSSEKMAPAFLPVTVEKINTRQHEPILVRSHQLTFELKVSQLAHLITELNRHA